MQLALKNHDLPLSHWEVVLEDVLHSVRSLLCTATNTTPHERFFNFQCRSGSCESLPSWQTDGRKVLNDLLGRRGGARHFHLGGPLGGQAKFLGGSGPPLAPPLLGRVRTNTCLRRLNFVNRMFARVHCPGDREVSVNLRDLAPCSGNVA